MAEFPKTRTRSTHRMVVELGDADMSLYSQSFSGKGWGTISYGSEMATWGDLQWRTSCILSQSPIGCLGRAEGTQKRETKW